MAVSIEEEMQTEEYGIEARLGALIVKHTNILLIDVASLDERNKCKKEVNLTQIREDERALLIAEVKKPESNVMLLNKEKVVTKQTKKGEGHMESQVWYLDNGASNHMTVKEEFKELDENMIWKVKFGDGSTVHIKGREQCRSNEKMVKVISLHYVIIL